MAKFLSLSQLALEFGLPPEEISREEYWNLAQQGWVEWGPENSGPGYGHEIIVVSPPGTSGRVEEISRLADRELTLG